MILLVTMSIDPHTDLIVDALEKNNSSFFRYNTDFADQYEIELSLNEGRIINSKNGKIILTSEIQAVWVRRRLTPEALNGVDESYRSYMKEQWQLFTEILLASIKDNVRWVNHPLAIESGKNKLRQLRVAREVGFDIPETWFTNSPQRFLSLTDSLEKTLYKQLSSGVIKDGEIAIYANAIEKDDLPKKEVINGLSISPGIFQPYIDKKYELRITVVGKKIFAAKIDSQNSETSRTDWRRYDFEKVKYEAVIIPADVEAKCIALIKKLGLNYGAIDMIVTPEDKYVFLEINVNGQWLWVEMLTGLQISRGIADLLSLHSDG